MDDENNIDRFLIKAVGTWGDTREHWLVKFRSVLLDQNEGSDTLIDAFLRHTFPDSSTVDGMDSGTSHRQSRDLFIEAVVDAFDGERTDRILAVDLLLKVGEIRDYRFELALKGKQDIKKIASWIDR